MKELPSLPPAAAVTAADLLYIVDASGNSRKISMAEIKQFINTDPSVVPSSAPYRGCLLHRTSDLSGIASGDVITWQEAKEDTDGFWSVGSPARIQIPTGVVKIRLSYSIEYTPGLVAGSVSANARINGFAVMSTNTISRAGTTGYNNNRVLGMAPVLSVAAGDYIEVSASFSMAGVNSIRAGATTWLAVDVVEAQP